MKAIYRYVKFGFEKVLTKILFSEESTIPVKKRLELMESILTEEQLKDLPKVISVAYIDAMENVRKVYRARNNRL